jgi:hypothetical protein
MSGTYLRYAALGGSGGGNATKTTYVPKKSLTLDGSSKAVNLGNNLSFDITSVFSISVWFNVTNSQPGGLVTKEDGMVHGYELYIASGIFDFGFFGASTTAYIENNVALNTGVWYHLIITYDGSQNANNIIAYLNGSLAATSVISNVWGANTGSTASCFFGSRNGSIYFNGLIDEFSFYNVVLNVSQASQIYNNGVPSDLSTLPFYNNVTNWYKIGDFPDNYTTLYDSVNLVNGTGVSLVNTDFTSNIA